MENSRFTPYDNFTSSFTKLKIKYAEYDESISRAQFLSSNDEVNVFINLESVLNNLSLIKSVEEKMMVQRDFNELIISNIINLAAHYKRFFSNSRIRSKIYLYTTDLKSNDFNERKINSDFRSYFLTKYNENPKFVLLSEKIKFEILPDVKTYCEFLPDIYLINSLNIDGSVIPYVIHKQDENRKNFIIGTNIFETQYAFVNNFMYNKIRGGQYNPNLPRFTDKRTDFIKNILNTDNRNIIELFYNPNIYCGLLAIDGDRIRSLTGIYKFGPKSYERAILEGLSFNKFTRNVSSPELLATIFNNEEDREDFIDNFNCMNIHYMYDRLTDAMKTSITSQVVDRVDINALNSLNATRFYNNPLRLEGLLL